MTSYMTSCSAEIGGFCDLSYLGVSLLSGVFFHYKQHNVAQLEHGNGCIPESPTITSSLGALSPRNPSAGAGRRQQCRLGRTCRSRWHGNQPGASGRRSPHLPLILKNQQHITSHDHTDTLTITIIGGGTFRDKGGGGGHLNSKWGLPTCEPIPETGGLGGAMELAQL